MVSVWDGRSELTEWPQRDWFLFFVDASYEPIFDQQPLTSSMIWARWITGRDGRNALQEGRDDGIFYRSSVPKLVNLDLYERVRIELAKRTKEQRESLGERRLSEPHPVVALPVVVSDESAQREVSVAKEVAPVDAPLVFCSFTNKIRHKSKLWALVHKNRLAALEDERHPEQLSTYKCRSCGDWHVGHQA